MFPCAFVRQNEATSCRHLLLVFPSFPKPFIPPLFELIVKFFAGSGYGSIVPDAQQVESHPLTKRLAEKIGDYLNQYIEAMEKVSNGEQFS